ncbi:NADH-quinone oxidoreductase subunit L [Amycolatopsis sp. SID8362]|uniref:NADH-quinone oxidoreductase subunit L n=1 Tax=Amycolatopsis sp. SID8362 TaxID=2690346 RepID=UPI00136A6C6B|nr:NADH-quinone oxidoreductase subunit L [Amycolatopsis sp. SID8362]NBH11848.1 NADH-quinone oxidoreductase subunit L [Amycolatopsis sp. SID8362]NED48539.1 NADH-quinone oxidoreductase subunit L [Amycolatopsis sp. SID8362]
MTASSWLLVALPALGALILLLAGKRAKAWGHLLGCATVTLAFIYGLILFFSANTSTATDVKVYSWIPVGQLQVDFGLRIDALSLTFVLLITGVGMLIHYYSIGYMADDEGRYRFFAYLNLFVASMLVLVLGNSFVTLYLGWEGVGLASYLLIGWYQGRPSAATAAKKAFLMNRVGDVGLALAIFIMFKYAGSTGYAQVFQAVGDGKFSPAAITAMAILLLLGACGKSGQFPLQAWLPDAMEGPTPVSALIHAATMVTAGVYLVARSKDIFNATEDGRLIVTLVGTVTLLLGCVIGCAYDDIKKVLAYSTVSQIGYMMLAVGLGPIAYALGIMHLVAHGFFKAGLFLGAGSVMHGMNDEVDMRKFGGLRKKMPITFITFGLGYLALIGIPPLSGFFTKDAIIEAAFGQGGWRGWVMGGAALLGAGLTAFYMTRLMVMTFFGKERWKDIKSTDGRDFHPHESKAIMWVPMAVLAVGSVGAGAFFALGDRFAHWLTPSVGELEEAHHSPLSAGVISIAAIVFSVLGVVLAYLIFRRDIPVEQPQRVSFVTRAARKDLYGNALNETLVARPGTWLARALVFVDNRGVDGAVNGLAASLGGGSGRLRRLQTGFVRSYALSMLGGTFLLLAALLLVRFS